MLTSENIFTAEGQLLIRANVEITELYIKRLRQVGIPAVYVHNPFFADAVPSDIIDEMTRIRLISSLQKEFLAIREGKPWNVQQFMDMSAQIVTEVTLNSRSLIQLTDTRSYKEATFSHSVNVAVLCVVIALAMDYPPRKMHDVALGGLLHDVGKMLIDPAIVNKRGLLTTAEYEIMMEHVTLGFDILRSAIPRIIPAPVMHMALQHHERPDGTGYPRQLAKSEILEYARIVAVADVYDEVTCDRPYSKARFPHEACLMMADAMNQQFDTEVLTAFLTRLAMYPVGSVVELSTGDIGVVVALYWGMQNRPTIRLMLNSHKKILTKKAMLDLRDHPKVEIRRVLGEEEVFTLSRLAHHH